MTDAEAAGAPPGTRLTVEEICSTRAPMCLARLHRATAPGARLQVSLSGPRRRGARTTMGPACADRLADLFEGAGFDDVRVPRRVVEDPPDLEIRARRARSLPDTVGPGMAMLVCGLNPSLHAADAGVGYVGPANRFWPALAELLGTEGADADRLLEEHRIGMTDLVKRATPAASALSRAEYRHGLERVGRLAGWLAPGVVCFVGLTGWRVGHPGATAGLQEATLGGRPVYVLPSTSGRNTHVSRRELVDHLGAALAVGRNIVRGGGSTQPDDSGSSEPD